ncbi:TetR/AcrR family transcriptional regulator [Parvularcula sp. IMCC14364]|uniref:TetR/AcrR family transcriptional regulator n=1 Tax=Parvularcula sp. IMCC14364 TaxID=3067902 RepID=UPI002740CA99|nr:TetR/AcrR family transcriptional regulator [Parvularcula sp. IMCC14364]
MPDASSFPQTDMRRRILDAAALLLAQNGYKATTLRNIAETAGLKAGSIYYHFPSKDQITVEVLNEGVRQVSHAVQNALNDTKNLDGARIMRAAVMAHLKALSEHSSYTRASIRCFSMVPEEIRQQTVEVRRAFDSDWLDILKTVQAKGAIHTGTDLKSLHLIILGTLNWTLEWQGASDLERAHLAQTLTSLILV